MKRNRLLPEKISKTFAMLAALFAMAFGDSSALAQVAGAITVYPQSNATMEIGTTSYQFTGYVPISPNTVVWSVNDVVGGNATLGTISATGLYKPPVAIPSPNVLTIKARSTAYPTAVGSSPLTLTRKVPHLWSASPSPLQAGSYVVSFNGSNFAADSIATANGVDLQTTYVNSTTLSVKGTAAVGPTVFQVRQPGLGAVSGDKVSVSVVAAIVTVSISPVSASVKLAATQSFAATVSGTSNTAVTWSVNGVAGGSAASGTISSAGLYTAPTALPVAGGVTIRATSQASSVVYAQATVTLTTPPPPPVTVSVTPAAVSVQLTKSQAFTATVANTPNTAVTWAVNGTVGGSAALGLISPAGVYTAPAAPLSNASTLTLTATSVASASVSAKAIVTLTAPPPAPAWLSGARFLEQTSFGPTKASLAELQQLGFAAYLDKQISLPETPIFVPASNSVGALQKWALYNYSAAPDQLRQRVAYSLSQIIATSANKLIYANEMIPWLQLLSKHALGNYGTLLREISVSPSMGKYLDMANSKRPGLSGGANENYAREIMQLFSIGLWELNHDGSRKLDAAGQPIAVYNQQTVAQVALAFTGWTYPTPAGAIPNPGGNWESFNGPMETRPASHALTSKTFLGRTLPAGQSVDQDMDGVIDTLFNHPNIAPFISTRLIRSLVKSNPSPQYISRIADVFDNNGAGVRGDLKAVVKAILMDSEARDDVPSVNGGRLKEPILQTVGLLRALGGGYVVDEQVNYLFDYMAQLPLAPASVFSWFSPLYHLPKSALFGPEFQIYTPAEATIRGNFLYWLLTNPGGSATLDLTPFQGYGNDMPGLVDAVNQTLLYGRMDTAMKQILITAATPGYDAATRITTVLYLTALSGQFAIQY